MKQQINEIKRMQELAGITLLNEMIVNQPNPFPRDIKITYVYEDWEGDVEEYFIITDTTNNNEYIGTINAGNNTVEFYSKPVKETNLDDIELFEEPLEKDVETILGPNHIFIKIKKRIKDSYFSVSELYPGEVFLNIDLDLIKKFAEKKQIMNEMIVHQPHYFSLEDRAELTRLIDSEEWPYLEGEIDLENNTYTFPLEDIENYASKKFEKKYGPGSYSDYDSPGFDKRIKEIYGIVRRQLELVLSKKYERPIKALGMGNESYW
jgi:hypothetical protein